MNYLMRKKTGMKKRLVEKSPLEEGKLFIGLSKLVTDKNCSFPEEIGSGRA
jgi:hypothetical protein